MTYYITNTNGLQIDWNTRGSAKIAQNCQNLLCIWLYEVAYERTKGIDPEIVDLPLEEARQKMRSEIYRVLRTYEPRAEIASVKVAGEEPGDLLFFVGLNIEG